MHSRASSLPQVPRDAFASKLAPTAAASAGTTCALAATYGWQRLGLEAAHIKWFQARGPDVVQNGLALCSLHHKIFDLGAFTVLPENHQIVFSRHLIGGDDTKAKLLAHHGAGLIQPQGKECLPNPEFLAWHRAEVFKEPGRE